MSLPVVFRDEAQADFDEAVRWYEEQCDGLGFEFIDEIQKTLDRIIVAPNRCPFVLEEARLALVKRFPYIIIYQVESDQILVLAVFHQRRDPTGWQDRV